VLPITVKTQKSTIQCVSMNVSRSGVGFLSEKLLPPGTVKLQIVDSSLSGKILYRKEHGRGTVVTSENVYQYGVKLDSAVSQSMLDKWVFTSRMPSRGRV